MRIFLFGFAAIFFLAGLGALISARSDIQLIVAVLAFGFGGMFLACDSLLGRLDKLLAARFDSAARQAVADSLDFSAGE